MTSESLFKPSWSVHGLSHRTSVCVLHHGITSHSETQWLKTTQAFILLSHLPFGQGSAGTVPLSSSRH